MTVLQYSNMTKENRNRHKFVYYHVVHKNVAVNLCQ